MSDSSDLNLLVSSSRIPVPKAICGGMVGISLVDGDRKLLQANKVFCDYLGYSLDELVGMTVDEFSHPADRHLTEKTFQSFHSCDDSVRSYEKRYLRKDGSTVWGLTTINRVAAEPGGPLLFVGFTQDITPQKEIEEQLCSTKDRYQALVENLGVGLSLVDRNHRILMVNSTLAQILDRAPADFVGKFCFREFEDQDDVCPHCPGVEAMASGEQKTVVVEGANPSGEPFKVRVKAFPVFSAEGLADGFVELVEDLTDQLQMEMALAASEERFRSIYEKSGVGMTVISRDGRILDANPVFREFVGYSLEELTAMTVQYLTHPEDRTLTAQVLESFNEEESRITYQKRFVRKDGATVWAEVAGVWVPGGTDGQGFGIGIIQDMTETKEAQARLDYLESHDELTGLPNRKVLRDRLTHAVARAERTNTQVGVLLVGLDRFSKIVGSFDHETGNLALCQIAERLRELVRQADTVSRLGDTEFVILLEDVGSLKVSRMVAQKVLRKIAETITVGSQSFHITASIGISLFPDDGADAEGLLKTASAAMNRAKQQGGDMFQYFIPELNARTRRLLSLEAELRKALKNQEFVLHFQPQIELRSRVLIGFEALVRWQSPARGLVMPADFIPLLEETGLIVSLGEWVLREACRQGVVWQKSGLAPVRIAVNISPRQFRRVDLPALVRNIVHETGYPPEVLELEVTESIIMDDIGRAIAIMQEIADLGVHLAIDDFGTGYSSLHYLRRFPVERLKVDRTFVKDVLTDPNDAAIASAVVALAKTMNLDVIAEGIETEDQLAFFLERGCRLGQGYLFSRPLDAAGAGQLLRNRGVEKPWCSRLPDCVSPVGEQTFDLPRYPG